jgi:hypothetical protein
MVAMEGRRTLLSAVVLFMLLALAAGQALADLHVVTMDRDPRKDMDTGWSVVPSGTRAEAVADSSWNNYIQSHVRDKDQFLGCGQLSPGSQHTNTVTSTIATGQAELYVPDGLPYDPSMQLAIQVSYGTNDTGFQGPFFSTSYRQMYDCAEATWTDSIGGLSGNEGIKLQLRWANNDFRTGTQGRVGHMFLHITYQFDDGQ